MKFNKWTLGLAAVGVVSLASVVKAEDTANTVLTALSATTISGYVDTSAQWNFGTGNSNAHNPPYAFGGANKADGFNLDVVQLSVAKPLDEGEWAAGYRVDLWLGPDANALGARSTAGTPADLAIRQGYVEFRTPVGNGLDWKLGVFDAIIGYESIAAPNDPNYTRSYGNTIEPTTHTGLLVGYRVNDHFSFQVGVANTVNAGISSRAQNGSVGTPDGGIFETLFPTVGLVAEHDNPYAESYKSYMGSVALTAPDSMGFLAGSTLYGGVVNGYNNSVLGSGAGLPQLNAYVGATIATPITGLRLGAAYDLLEISSRITGDAGSEHIQADIWTLATYASFQATEKLSLHARFEVADGTIHRPIDSRGGNEIYATTATVQYDLWKNVLSRVEFRWDHCDHGMLFGANPDGAPDRANAFLLAANVIYKF